MPVRMAVNVVPRQFQRASLPAMVGSALAEAHLAPQWLTLEMTEGTLMDGTNDTIGILSDLRDQGVSLAIDDFGTGYSSLSYLKRFPLDKLKVDQCFVRDIEGDPDNLAILGVIINLGHTLRLTVVAEGVESVAELDLLRQHQCDQAQGFYFSRGLPPTDVEALLHGKMRAASA
jgi:EAL domain-containing protein (putative c-di-GMP-specific phosphodiesterase class I)